MQSENVARNDVQNSLEERWKKVTEPRHPMSQAMVAFWRARPAGGLVVGRDIPSREIAKLLAHIMLWDPVGDCEDLILRHMGERLRERFGANVTGRKLSELVAADVCAYHCGIDRKLLQDDDIAIFDIHIIDPVNAMWTELAKVHFEMVVMTAVARNGIDRQILAGTFYFDKPHAV